MTSKQLSLVALAAIAGVYLGIAAYGECREAGNSVLFCATAVFG